VIEEHASPAQECERPAEAILLFSTAKPLPEARARSRHCRSNSPISTPNGISDKAKRRCADLSKRRVRGSAQPGSLKALAVMIQIRNSSSCSAEVAERCRKNSLADRNNDSDVVSEKSLGTERDRENGNKVTRNARRLTRSSEASSQKCARKNAHGRRCWRIDSALLNAIARSAWGLKTSPLNKATRSTPLRVILATRAWRADL